MRKKGNEGEMEGGKGGEKVGRGGQRRQGVSACMIPKCNISVGWVWLCKCYCVYIHTYKICESAAFLATPFSSAFVSLLPLSLLLPCFPPFFLPLHPPHTLPHSISLLILFFSYSSTYSYLITARINAL